MIGSFHRLRRDEDGQALVLGAVLLLVIALAMLGLARLGVRIHDRVALQDGADAAAYSLAVEEARAFNLYAYTNRAQIAQYVTVLQLLSIDAMLQGVLVGLGGMAAIAKTVGELCDGVKRTVCMHIPLVGPLLVAASEVMRIVERVMVVAGRAIDLFDLFVGEVAVPALVGSNLFLFANQLAIHGRVVERLTGDEALRIAGVAAPGARWALPLQPINVLRFEQAHLLEAMALWGDRDREGAVLKDGAAGRRNLARRGMSELIHASRADFWIYDRTFPDSMGHLLRGVEGIEVVEDFLSLLPVGRLAGHTRLLSIDAPRPGRSESIYEGMEKAGYGNARYPTGSAIGANFFLDPGGPIGPIADLLGLEEKHFASVTSTSPESGGGWVCTWDVRDPYRWIPSAPLMPVYAPRYSCDVGRGRHPWWGITPHMAFDATGEHCDTAAGEYCQPDVWVALQLGEEGQKAVARALAYYHRPGNWQEPPNFFNPFWRARLAPVETGIGRLGAAGDALRALVELL